MCDIVPLSHTFGYARMEVKEGVGREQNAKGGGAEETR